MILPYIYKISTYSKETIQTMKKALFTLLPATMLLLACSPTPSAGGNSSSTDGSAHHVDAKTTDLKIATPAGAPYVALFPYMKESSSSIEGVAASSIAALLGQNSPKDVVIAPTNAGINAIVKQSSPFRLAATVTFGNFFLAATGNDENKTLDPDDYVVAFQQGQVPDKVFTYLYSGLTNVHYIKGEAVTPASTLIKGIDEENDNAKVDYVLIPEPALTTAMSKQPKASIYANLQDLYRQKSGQSIAQASIFVRPSADKTKVSSFLDGVKEGVEAFLSDPSVIDEHLAGLSSGEVKAAFTADADALKSMTSDGNRMGLGYKAASENKQAISAFMGLWGMSEVDEEVYYR